MKRVPLLLGALLLLCGAARADDLGRLIHKADTVSRGNSSAGVLEMEIKTESYHRTYQMVIWYDGSNTGKSGGAGGRTKKIEKTLVKILGPAMWRGHGTLKIADQLKLYNPRTNHVTVVSHSMLGDSWMGSHFTNDDLVKETELARHFHHKLLKKWTGKDGAGHAVTFYRIKLTPKPSAPVAWGKIVYVIWERANVDGGAGGGATTVLPERAEYFRKVGNSRPDRTLTFSDVKKLGGREVPAKMTMTVAKKPGEHTSITYKKLKFDLKIPGSKFTEQALRR
jgi:hypothetical protein